MARIKLNVEPREKAGKIKVKNERANNNIPGVVYGQGDDAVSISMVEKELNKVYQQAGSSIIIDLDINGELIPVLFREVQMHPYKNQYTHVDFYKVDMKQPLKVNIPVVLLNRDDIYLQPSVLMQAVDEIEIEVLPTDIPSTAEYDVQEMQYGDTVHLSDLDIYGDDRFTFFDEPDLVVATLSEPQEEEPELDEIDVDATDVPTVDETEAPGDAETEESASSDEE